MQFPIIAYGGLFMKRPLAVIGAVFAIAAAAAVFLGREMFPLLFAVCFLAAGLSLKNKRLRRTVYVPAVLLTAAAAVASVSIYTLLKVEPSEVCLGKTARIDAVLCELPYQQYGRYYYKLDAKSIVTEDGKTVNDVKMIVSSAEDLKLEPYDKIEADIDFFKSALLSSVTKGVMLRGTVSTEKTVIVTKTSDKPPYYYALMARKGISQKISDLLPEKESAFVTAFITGDKSSVPEDVRSDLRKSGLPHIIVVSGLHISVLSRIMFLFFMLVSGKNVRASSGMCIAVVVMYMAVAGFSPSVLRAGIMQIIMLSGMIFWRKADPINSLGFAVLLITVCDPYAAADISLILSASATFGILAVAPEIEKRIKEISHPLNISRMPKFRRYFEPAAGVFISVFSVSFSAYLMTLPAIILYFKEVPTYSVITNILIAYVIPLMILAVVLMLVLSFLPWLAVPFAFVTRYLADFIIAVAGRVSSIPFSVINVSQDFVPFWLAAVILLAVILLLLRRKRYRVRIFAITAVLTFVTGSVVSELADRDIIRIAVLDSGDGLSVVITENNNSIVLCCGGEYGVSDPVSGQLDSTMTEQVQLLLLTGSSHKTSLYASHILRDYTVMTAAVYDSDMYSDEVRSLLDNAENRIEYGIRQGNINEFRIGDKTVKSLVTWTNRCIYLDLHGYSALICSDKTNCEYIPESWRSADLLIVNGMPRNTYLLKYKTLIVSDSNENKDKYKKLSKYQSTMNTYDGGNIVIRLKNNNEFETRRESSWLS